mmetsp:Transcript_3198/g.6525  ORF Transcript_3198/g.6525 Transcript_3198/m.6525 type:complete len:103 (-) Transcript_3198:388-696(-)
MALRNFLSGVLSPGEVGSQAEAIRAAATASPRCQGSSASNKEALQVQSFNCLPFKWEQSRPFVFVDSGIIQDMNPLPEDVVELSVLLVEGSDEVFATSELGR